MIDQIRCHPGRADRQRPHGLASMVAGVDSLRAWRQRGRGFLPGVGRTCDTLHAHVQVLGKVAVVLAAPEPRLQRGVAPDRTGLGDPALRTPEGSGCAGGRSRSSRPRGGCRTQRREGTPRAADSQSAGGRGHARGARGGQELGGRRRDRSDPAGGVVERPPGRGRSALGYDPAHVAAYFAAATQAALVLAAFRAPYRGAGRRRSTRGGVRSTWP
jgi:hypothetical protein